MAHIEKKPVIRNRQDLVFIFFSRLAVIWWLTVAVCVNPLPVRAQAGITYPKEIVTTAGPVITIYQPQPENLTGNKLTGRSAVSIRKTPKSEPVLGAIFY